MTDIIELRKAIKAYLLTIHARVYFQSAPDAAVYPYLVYNLPSSFDDNESAEVFVLEVDGWDKPATGDTTTLEQLMAAVDGNGDAAAPTGLNRKTINTASVQAQVYRDSRLVLEDDDPRIHRRKYTYQVKVF